MPTCWLFAQTASINAPHILHDLGLGETALASGVAAAGMVCGMIIAVAGRIADRNGHVRMVVAGNIVNIVGALLVALTPVGTQAAPAFVLGRVLQGAAAALIMPATLTMVRTFWGARTASAPSRCGHSVASVAPGSPASPVACAARR